MAAPILAENHLQRSAAGPQSLSQTRPEAAESDWRRRQLQSAGCWPRQVVPRLPNERAERQAHPAPDNHTATTQQDSVDRH